MGTGEIATELTRQIAPFSRSGGLYPGEVSYPQNTRSKASARGGVKFQRRRMVISYHILGTSPTEQWLELLNSELVRKHLMEHPPFTVGTFDDWLDCKAAEDQRRGCRLREIRCDGKLAGWCGIQFESGAFEAALVLSPAHWGRGREVVNEIKRWAKEMGHTQLLAHFPRSRPQAKALTRLFGSPIGSSQIKDHAFVTYKIDI